MKYRTTLGVMLLTSLAGLAQDKPAAPPTPLTFGDAHVTVPPGWKHLETQAGANRVKVLLVFPPDNTKTRSLAVLLLPGQDLKGADFAQAFDAALKKAVAPNERIIQYSELPARKTTGYDFLTRSMVVADDAGHRSVRVCFGANPRHRLEMLIVSADSKETLKHYEAGVASLLRSYSFAEASVSADTENEEPGRPDSGFPGRQDPSSETKAETGSAAVSPRTVAPGKRARVPEGGSVLLCTDATRLDGAMDFAKLGDSYNALRALRNDAFFRVTGPASLEVTESELKSRWPKVFVKVLDGDSAGRTGWVVVSELEDLKQPAR